MKGSTGVENPKQQIIPKSDTDALYVLETALPSLLQNLKTVKS